MTELWCIHVEGPDDIIAMPSKEMAQRDADTMNKNWHNRSRMSRLDPIFRAVVKLYPGTPAQHDAELRRNYDAERR
jgi:hypothetical protein